jgi:rubrerythrin
MDVFNLAISMERDGEAFFRDLAGRCTNGKIRTLLEMLADAE